MLGMQINKPKTWSEFSIKAETETYELFNNTSSIDSIISFSSLDIWPVDTNHIGVSGVTFRKEFTEVKWINGLVVLNH